MLKFSSDEKMEKKFLRNSNRRKFIYFSILTIVKPHTRTRENRKMKKTKKYLTSEKLLNKRINEWRRRKQTSLWESEK